MFAYVVDGWKVLGRLYVGAPDWPRSLLPCPRPGLASAGPWAFFALGRAPVERERAPIRRVAFATLPAMATVISVEDMPGSERAKLFEGREHGATVTFFLNRHAPGEGPGLHRHPYEETFIVEEGTPTFTVDGETIEARPGQIVVVPAGAAHRFVNSGGERLRQVSIHACDHLIQEDLEPGT